MFAVDLNIPSESREPPPSPLPILIAESRPPLLHGLRTNSNNGCAEAASFSTSTILDIGEYYHTYCTPGIGVGLGPRCSWEVQRRGIRYVRYPFISSVLLTLHPHQRRTCTFLR